MEHPLASRPAQTLYVLGCLVAVSQGVPRGRELVRFGSSTTITSDALRVLQPREEVANEVGAAAAPAVSESVAVGEVALGATHDEGQVEVPVAAGPKPGLAFGGTAAAREVTGGVPGEAKARAIEDPSGHALDAFYEALERVERKEAGAIARMTYYGDSVIASDWISATLRRKLQARFGDAGHGLLLVADAWPGYHHDGVSRHASKGWKVSRVVGPYAPDGLYGLGGVSFVAEGPGMFATVGTAKTGPVGRSVSRFVVTYAEAPGGGALSLKLDDEAPRVVQTAGDATRVKTVEVRAPDGPHRLEIRSNGGGNVRVFHVTLERDEPGVVVDAVGIIGCRLRFLDKLDDAHWADELRRRDPSLVAFTYGANESADGFAYPMDQYEASARAVLKQVREALPRSSCLLISPMDAAEKRGETMASRPVVAAMVAVQRKLAAELGCGFFDTWQAMGGAGSMGVWMARGLGGADMIHPTSTGAEVIGGWVNEALMQGHAAYRSRRGAAAVGGPSAAPAGASASVGVAAAPAATAASSAAPR